MLTTLVAPTGGQAWVAGHDVTRDPVAVKRRIGVVTQNNTLDMQLTVPENLEFRSRFFGLPKAAASRRAAQLHRRVRPVRPRRTRWPTSCPAARPAG